jgi:hypothetical protein
MSEKNASSVEPLSKVLDRLLKSVGSRETVSFRTLVKAAALDPTRDFVGMSLRDMDFRDEDLRDFNFSNAELTGADFRRARIEGARFEGASLEGAIGLPDEIYAVAEGTNPPHDFNLAEAHRIILSGSVCRRSAAGSF